MKNLVLLGCLVTLLGGCAALDRMEQKADQQACERFGFKMGTDAYANCLMQQAAQHKEEDQRVMDRQKMQELRKKR